MNNKKLEIPQKSTKWGLIKLNGKSIGKQTLQEAEWPALSHKPCSQSLACSWSGSGRTPQGSPETWLSGGLQEGLQPISPMPLPHVRLPQQFLITCPQRLALHRLELHNCLDQVSRAKVTTAGTVAIWSVFFQFCLFFVSGTGTMSSSSAQPLFPLLSV